MTRPQRAPCTAPWSLEVTRRLSASQQETSNTIHYICPWETFTTRLGTDIGMGLCQLRFSLFLSVYISVLICCFQSSLQFSLADRKYDNDYAFRKFKRQLYHSSISAILETLHDGMTKLVVRRCPDGHYRRVIYDIGPFIADYPKQVMLAGVVQGWCPRYARPLSIVTHSLTNVQVYSAGT